MRKQGESQEGGCKATLIPERFHGRRRPRRVWRLFSVVGDLRVHGEDRTAFMELWAAALAMTGTTPHFPAAPKSERDRKFKFPFPFSGS